MAVSAGIIADDLSGAMDAGLQLVNENYSVKVFTRPDKVRTPADSDFIVVNTESRHLPPEQATAAVKKGIEALSHIGRRLAYKKIDSTLRGNIGAELEETLTSSGADCIVMAPALPYIKRTTVNGIHYVDGVRLQDTEFARDPLAPLFTSSVQETAGRQIGCATGLLPIDTIRMGNEPIVRAVTGMMRQGARIIVCDTIDDGDLSAISNAVTQCRGKIILCGSAGLIKYLGKSEIGPSPLTSARRLKMLRANSRVLVISGAPAMISRQQILEAAAKFPEARLISADPGALLSEAAYDEIDRICGEVKTAFGEGRHVLLDCAPADGSELMQPARNASSSASYWTGGIPKLAARVASIAASCDNLGAVVLFEGSAAISFLDALGVTSITILRQTEPYMPLGILTDGVIPGLNLITKAASFGGRNSLVNIMNGLIRRIQK